MEWLGTNCAVLRWWEFGAAERGWQTQCWCCPQLHLPLQSPPRSVMSLTVAKGRWDPGELRQPEGVQMCRPYQFSAMEAA